MYLITPRKLFSIFPMLAMLSVVLYGCQPSKTEFYLAKERVIIRTNEGMDYYEDVIFISNPPDDIDHLVKLIEKYNDSTLRRDTLESKYDYFGRTFYRESYKTPRDFKDDLSSDTEYLYDHDYDFIGKYQMKQCSTTGNIEWSLLGKKGYLNFDDIYYGKSCFQN